VFERGFKAWCERLSLQKREDLGVKSSDPLDPRALAENLCIRVWSVDQIPGLPDQTKKILLSTDDNSGWSAATICLGKKRLIILNSSHSLGRQASDLMHELSHHMLDHKPAALKLSAGGIMMLETYDQQQEEQADWLSGCLLLPRDALVHIKRRRIESAAAAKTYGVSFAMLRYRMGVTGVNYQFV
jgi:Zn-dependent peptidase ImmA (M78 family)